LILCHRFPGIELISPIYASNGAICHLPLNSRIYVGSKTKISFNINSYQKEYTGILMYKLQKSHIDQSNEKVISSEETTYTQLVIIWKINDSGEFSTASYLLEHDKNYIWKRNKLIELAKHYELVNIQLDPIEKTWLINNHTVLMTSLSATRKKTSHELKINLYETSINKDTQRPQYIDLNV
jgi:hypothetical protein